jgi:hypothetical protein
VELGVGHEPGPRALDAHLETIVINSLPPQTSSINSQMQIVGKYVRFFAPLDLRVIASDCKIMLYM